MNKHEAVEYGYSHYSDKQSHFLRGQTQKALDKLSSQGIQIPKCELVFTQRRNMNRPTRSGK